MGFQFTVKNDTAHDVNNQITLFLQGNNLIFNIFLLDPLLLWSLIKVQSTLLLVHMSKPKQTAPHHIIICAPV
jgi:hypothetical protein